MTRKKGPAPHDIALFRYHVIGHLLPEPRGKVAPKARELSKRQWDIPGSVRARVGRPPSNRCHGPAPTGWCTKGERWTGIPKPCR